MAFFALPFLSRIYLPEEYAIVTIFLSVNALIAPFATLSYHHALIVETDDDRAKKAFNLNMAINAIFFVVALLLVLLFNRAICNYFNNQELAVVLPLAPVFVFLSTVNVLFTYWANRKKEYRIISQARILNSLLYPAMALGIGLLWRGYAGLFIGVFTAMLTSTIYIVVAIRRKYGSIWQFSGMRGEFLRIMRANRKFMMFSLPVELLSNFLAQIPVFLIGKVGRNDMKDLGYYNRSNMILGVPATLVSGSISEVFRQRAAEDLQRTGSCRQILLKVVKKLFLIAVVPFTLIVLFSDDIVRLLLGPKWMGASVFLKIMALMFFFKFVVSPVTYIMNLRHKQGLDLLMHVLLIVGIFITYFINQWLQLGLNTFMFLYSACYSLFYIIYFFICLKYSTIHE